MVSMGTLTAFMVVSVAVPVMRKKDPDAPQGFRVPFGPLVPILSILACLIIMAGLSGMTYAVFSIWMVVALAIYFTYGLRNSKLN